MIGMNQLSKKEIKEVKEFYLGKTVVLTRMEDFQPVPAGTTGVVKHVDDIGTLHVNWENGSSLGLIIGIDDFLVIEED